ncbi:MAG: hypothetical protein JXR76_15795 [Deltaproteobacteria bacterium]|nr:hypothetical protein [Deltaproteobacteria bacterium]
MSSTGFFLLFLACIIPVVATVLLSKANRKRWSFVPCAIFGGCTVALLVAARNGSGPFGGLGEAMLALFFAAGAVLSLISAIIVVLVKVNQSKRKPESYQNKEVPDPLSRPDGDCEM